MRLLAIQYLILIAVIILIFATDLLVGKRNRDRHNAGNGAKDKKTVAEDTCVNGYCLDPTYNKLELPPTQPSNVKINLEVLDVLTVDDKRFSVQINMYFGVLWTEERLKLPKTSNSSAPVSWLPIDLNFMTHLWVPNVFVYNLAAFETLECLQKLSGLWIVKNKELFYNQATHVTFMCPMRFNKFPLDEHICKFMVGSTNYDDTRMTFDNEKLTYNAEEGNTILDYKVIIIPLQPADQVLAYGESGNYSITGFEMTLTRNIAKYLYIYYLPSGLFVAVSWVSFVIPPEVVPGRMALLVTLFLVLTNIFNTITNVSPNVEGMTAISSWMIACMFFVFLALLEYAAILYFLLVKKKFQMVKKRRNLTVIHNKDCFLYQGSELNKRKEEIAGLDQGQKLAKVDTIFLYVFPLTFFAFNIVYWPFWSTY